MRQDTDHETDIKGINKDIRAASYAGGYNDGGFAEYCAVRIDGICTVPEDVDPADVAPLMCAGVTCFSE